MRSSKFLYSSEQFIFSVRAKLPFAINLDCIYFFILFIVSLKTDAIFQQISLLSPKRPPN